MDVISLGVEVKTTGAQRARDELGRFTNATKSAAGASDQLEDQLRRTQAATNQFASSQTNAASSTTALGRGMTGLGGAFKQNSSGIQNASFQLQDIIVQMEMGVPISRTLGQQLPQLLGGFGALGAVVGLAVGSILAIGGAMLGASTNSKTLKESIDELEDAIARLNSVRKEATSSELAEKYGAQAADARELLEVQRQILQIEAERAFRAASTSVTDVLGAGLENQTIETAITNAIELNKVNQERIALAEMGERIARGELQLTGEQEEAYIRRKQALDESLEPLLEYRRGLNNIAMMFQVSEDAASKLLFQLIAVRDAETDSSRLDATQALVRAIEEVTGGLKLSTDEALNLVEELVRSGQLGLELKGALSGGADEAARMADELSRAASNALAASQNALTARREAEIRQQFSNDPVGQARALAEVRNPIVRQGDLPDPVARFINSLRGETIENSAAAAQIDADTRKFLDTLKGGSKTLNDIERDAARLYESTRTEAERYAAELEKVEALFAVGAINGEVYGRALEDLNAKFDPFTKLMIGVADTIENELNSAFASVLKGTADLGDALLSFASNVLAKVAQDLFAQQFASPISSALTGILGGVAGGGTGSLGLPMPFAKGGVVEQAKPIPFAKGGIVSGPTLFEFAKGTGLMGEAGPEAIMPLKRGPDGALGVSASTDARPPIIVNDYSTHEGASSALIDAIKDLLRVQPQTAQVVPFAPELDVQRQVVPFAPELDVQRQVVPFAPELDVQRQVVPFAPELDVQRQVVPFAPELDVQRQVVPFAPELDVQRQVVPFAPEPIPARQPAAAQAAAQAAPQGAAQPNITINNYSGQEATASSDGAGNIVVEIGRAIAQDITSGGPTYRAIRTTFGLSNRLQQRG
jgi:hypothetical protein